MSSKSSSFRLPPHCGVGFSRNDSSAFSLNSSIHSGSSLCLEIMATISGSIPFLGVLKKYSSGSWKPYLYSSSPSSWMVLSSGICSTPSLALSARAELLAHPLVALVLEIHRQLLAAAGHDTPVEHDVDVIRLDVPQNPLIVRDDYGRKLGAPQFVHALRHDLQGVDVEPGVRLHDAHLLLQEPVHLHGRELFFAHGVDRGSEEVGHRDAGNLARVLEGEEHA